MLSKTKSPSLNDMLERCLSICFACTSCVLRMLSRAASTLEAMWLRNCEAVGTEVCALIVVGVCGLNLYKNSKGVQPREGLTE